MVWAAGGSISGVPANPTPAKVLNLSLGGTGSCPITYQNAINAVRAKGAVVAAALVFRGRPATQNKCSPLPVKPSQNRLTSSSN